MQLENLLESLNYKGNRNYHQIEEVNLNDKQNGEKANFGLDAHILRSAKEARIEGVYTFQASPETQNILPPHAAVYVAKAKIIPRHTKFIVKYGIWVMLPFC